MKFYFAFLFIVFFQNSHSQVLQILEDSIHVYYTKLQTSATENDRNSASNRMRELFVQSFGDPGIFEFPFERLKLCKITSSDGRVRLINWNQPADDGSSKYYCFVLWKNLKTGELSWQELTDTQHRPDKLEDKYLNAEKWFGTLYFDIIPMGKKKRSDTYTLLGWESKDNLTTCKVMDALSISNGNVRLGAPIFKDEKDRVRKRIIFEYSNDVSMSVKYHSKKKTIVVDHLSPRSSMMEGIYADYGPDGSYDAYQLRKGKWEFQSNIDVGTFSEEEDRPYVDPRRQ